MAKIIQAYGKVKALRERFYRAVQGKESLLKMLDEAEVAEQVYNSNAIENSTLTLEETEKILLQMDLDRYISERELFEAKNLAKVVTYMNNKAKEKELNLEMILFLHKMLLANIRDDIAGRIRKAGEWVRVANYIAPDPQLVEDQLKEMLIINNANNFANIIQKIAFLHLTFEHIHPFVDGNGRIGRVINNYLLIKAGYVPINIKFIEREKYYAAFRQFDQNKSTKIMEEIVGRALMNSYHKRLAYLEGKEIILLAEYAKKNRLSHSNLLNKANRQTIEAFMEKGVWKIGI
jgi:Fic family protein